MRPSLLLAIVVAFSQASFSLASDKASTGRLFEQLDQNQDGKIASTELNDSQQPFFVRALRVADVNEDGMLTAEEFSKAVSDPKPTELPGTNLNSRVASMDVRSLDKNGDGLLTLEEVPAAMKERYQQLLDRVGSDSIAVDKVQAYLRGERPAVTEQKKNPEMNSAMKSNNSEPKPNSPGSGVSRAVFNQLDRNSDGKLSGDEIPRRMKQNLKAADRDNNGSVSRSEFDAAIDRRRQK
jgi:Ca2+-binding EF-hand superfamily protein